MKILQVNYIFPPKLRVADGVTNIVYNISKELARKGHEVSIYTSNALNLVTKKKLKKLTYLNIEGIHVHYLNYILKYKTFFLTPGLGKLLKQTIKDFDIVHIHDPRSYQGILTFLFAAKNRIPCVFQLHGSFLSITPDSLRTRILRTLLDRTISTRLIENSSKIIALNQNEAEQYVRHLGIAKERIAIIPNGIDLSSYRNLPEKGHLREMLNIPEEKKIILYMGRIHRIKGLDFLVKTYAYLTRKQECKDTALVIVGPDDGYLHKLKVIINRFNLNNTVFFTGPLFGMAKLKAYVDADVFVLPSRYETFPISLLEAYACAKPIICTDTLGLKDLVINGVTGLLVQFGDIKLFAKSIHYMLNNSKNAHKMGLRGREFIEENFKIETIVNRLEALFLNITDGG